MTWINYELKDPEYPDEILAILSKFKELVEKGHWPGLKITKDSKEVWIDLPPEENAQWFVSLIVKSQTKQKIINFYLDSKEDPATIAAFAFMLLDKVDKVEIGKVRTLCRR